jgi:hypothetical protein
MLRLIDEQLFFCFMLTELIQDSSEKSKAAKNQNFIITISGCVRLHDLLPFILIFSYNRICQKWLKYSARKEFLHQWAIMPTAAVNCIRCTEMSAFPNTNSKSLFSHPLVMLIITSIVLLRLVYSCNAVHWNRLIFLKPNAILLNNCSWISL